MSKIKKLRKKFSAFVNQLTPDVCREQLVLAYLQMEKCLQVLRGEDVEPVSMKDNGESSDLELFYMCKKVREELDCLEQEKSMSQGEKITIVVDVDCSEAIKHVNEIKKEFDRFESYVNESFKPSKTVIDAIRKYARDFKPQPKFKVGEILYFMDCDSICSLAVNNVSYDKEEKTFVYSDRKGNHLFEDEVFPSIDELLSHLKTDYNERNGKD